MTETGLDQGSETQILVASAAGSLLLHGLLIAGLATMVPIPIVKIEPPTVQVNLVASPKVLQEPIPEPPSPIQPHIARRNAIPLPAPLPKPNRSQPQTVPLQAALTPPPLAKRSPLTPPSPNKPILQDNRASQALQSRKMMKMRVPTQTQRATPSLPRNTTRIYAQNHATPPLPTIRNKRVVANSLPAPPLPPLPTRQAIKAALPTATGTKVTRPTIITSSRPTYPRVARESGWEGTVIVRTLVDTNGRPSQVTIRKSCGYPTLDQAAKDAVHRWKFTPAKDGNIPITKWVDIPIKFDLHS